MTIKIELVCEDMLACILGEDSWLGIIEIPFSGIKEWRVKFPLFTVDDDDWVLLMISKFDCGLKSAFQHWIPYGMFYHGYLGCCC